MLFQKLLLITTGYPHNCRIRWVVLISLYFLSFISPPYHHSLHPFFLPSLKLLRHLRSSVRLSISYLPFLLSFLFIHYCIVGMIPLLSQIHFCRDPTVTIQLFFFSQTRRYDLIVATIRILSRFECFSFGGNNREIMWLGLESKHVDLGRNVGSHKICTAPHLRRRHSSELKVERKFVLKKSAS
jgi:hypothetical protein